MTKKTTMTQTQINAVCNKLKRDFNPSKTKTGKTADEMCDANIKFVTKLIKGLTMPAALKKFLLADNAEFINDFMDEKEMKAIGAPYPDPFADAGCEYKLKRKHDEMVDDLKFELTMTDVDDYKRIMSEFNARVAKALSK